MKKLRLELDQLQKDKTSIQSQLDDSKKEAGQISAEKNKIKAELDAAQLKISNLDTEKQGLTEKIAVWKLS